MPGVMIIEALAQTAGILAFVTAGVIPDEKTRLLLRRHRQGALPQAGGAGRPADPGGRARARDQAASGGSPRAPLVGEQEVALADMMVAPESRRQ